jgi:hypothetical protein
MESYHGCSVPWNVHLSNTILTQQNPHTHRTGRYLHGYVSYHWYVPVPIELQVSLNSKYSQCHQLLWILWTIFKEIQMRI